MRYAGALRRAFQLPVAHEVEPKACARRLWLPLYGPCVISEHVEMRFLATTPCSYLHALYAAIKPGSHILKIKHRQTNT